jgi:hypothetical protein
MIELPTFFERLEYLRLPGNVGEDTFGYDRYLNQAFYDSREWADVRSYVIARDLGCDLAIGDLPIFVRPLVHHMNPVTKDDLVTKNTAILDPEFLVLASHDTHNNIHYGLTPLQPKVVVARSPGDTKLW